MFDAAPTLPLCPLSQSLEYERALRLAGQNPLRHGTGTLVLRRRFGPLPVHMLARCDNTVAATGLRGAIILSPDHPIKTMRALPLISPASVAEIDLSGSSQDLRARLNGKWRNRLVRAEALGLRLQRQNMPPDPNHWLIQAEHAQQRQRGYRNFPAALTCAFAQANPGDAKLFSAHLGSDTLAGLLILRHGAVATYHIGFTSTAGRLMSAHNVLMWAAMEWAQRKGVARLDLGLIDTERAPGLARFKLGTGAHTRKLGGTWLRHPLLRPFYGLARLDRNMMHQAPLDRQKLAWLSEQMFK